MADIPPSAHLDPVVEYVIRDERVGVRRVNDAFDGTFEPTVDGSVRLDSVLATEAGLTALGDAVAEGDTTPVDAPCETVDGRRTFRIRNVPSDDGGHIVFTDIADLTERLGALEERNARLDSFAQVVSHDLRNHIETADIHVQRLRDGDDGSPDHVADALEKMRALVEDVLNLAREGRVIDTTERTALAAATTDAWDSVDTADATLDLREENATLQMHPDRLSQALANLFRNAVEHVGTDVTVTVGTLADPDDTGFYVADDGPGIPEAEREEVLEPGVTSATDGTGLGLAIVERIVEAHGWTVAVTEREGGGARFEVSGVESLQPF